MGIAVDGLLMSFLMYILLVEVATMGETFSLSAGFLSCCTAAREVIYEPCSVKKGFNSLPNDLNIKRPYGRRLWKILWEKKKTLVNSIFFFSHSVFYSIKERNHHFTNTEFEFCKCFQFGKKKTIL